MKSNKFCGIVMMFVITLSSAGVFTSCDKPDDTVISKEKKDEKSTMVGKWKYSWEDGYCLLTFKSDGTGTYFEYDNGKIDAENDPFYWSYEETGSILTIMWLEDGQVDDKEVVRLTWINNKTFTADLMDDGSVWVKQ